MGEEKAVSYRIERAKRVRRRSRDSQSTLRSSCHLPHLSVESLETTIFFGVLFNWRGSWLQAEIYERSRAEDETAEHVRVLGVRSKGRHALPGEEGLLGGRVGSK